MSEATDREQYMAYVAGRHHSHAADCDICIAARHASRTNYEKVRAFHKAFEMPAPPEPVYPTYRRTELRINLIEEELEEAKYELRNGTITNIAKELADLLYVVYGTAVEFGIPMDEVFAEVHASNMTKLGPDGRPMYREDGKVLKGPNYQPPDLWSALGEEAT